MSREESDVAVLHCDCYVHTGSRFINKIVENAASRRSSICPLLGIPSMPPPMKFGNQTNEHKVSHQRIEDEAVLEEVYKLGRVLGKGSFGVVVAGQNVKSEKWFAIKQVNKEKAGSAAVKLLEREVAILKKVKHAHIIQLEEILETSKKMFLVMEICEYGDLKTLLFSDGPFSEESSRHVIKDLAEVVAYLHKNGIVHRDIKLENILIASRSESESKEILYDIRVTDFGLSVMKDGTNNMLQAACGTPVYMAPEVVQNHEYSQQCDNWSIGVILYALLCSRFPFSGDTEERLFENINKAEVNFAEPDWTSKSSSVKNLIKNILVVDPAHRYTANEIASHPWSTGSKDSQTNMPTNVLTMMKDYAKIMAEESLDHDEEERSISADKAHEVASNKDIQNPSQATLDHPPTSPNPAMNQSSESSVPTRANQKNASLTTTGTRKVNTPKKPMIQRKESAPASTTKNPARSPLNSPKIHDNTLSKPEFLQRRTKEIGRSSTSSRGQSNGAFEENDLKSPGKVGKPLPKSNQAAKTPKR